MGTHNLSFGYYPRRLDCVAGDITISSFSDLAEKVELISADEGVEGKWIYAPPQEVQQMGVGIVRRPYTSRVFGLPKTHNIEHSKPRDESQVTFHVWALSFFLGMRLTTTEAGFLDATPIQPGVLNDFVLSGRCIPGAVELAEVFWIDHQATPERARLITASIHALFLAQDPQNLQFEKFLYLYTAFDACFALAKAVARPKSRITHGQRLSWMCDSFGIPVPTWADPAAPGGAEVANIRNATFHEALFVGEPLGFAVYGVGTSTNLTLEMEALVCRLIVALFGADDTTYVASPVNTRVRHMLSL